VVAGSRVDIVRSGVAAAVPADAPAPDLSSEDAMRRAVLAAPSVSVSTGPSGVALLQRFADWGIAGEIGPRMVQPPPGVPVGSLVAKGEVALGFQQLSELMHLPGLQVLALPEAVQIVTVFSGGVCAASQRPDDVRQLLAALAAPDTADTKRRHGMAPA